MTKDDTRQSPSVPVSATGSPRSPQRERSAHTPGPWHLDSMGLSVYATNPYRHGDMRVLDVRGWGHLTGAGACRLPEDDAIAIQKANGAIAAAAPELLTACKAVAREMRSHIDSLRSSTGCPDLTPKQCAWAERLEAVIAKAEGR